MSLVPYGDSDSDSEESDAETVPKQPTSTSVVDEWAAPYTSKLLASLPPAKLRGGMDLPPQSPVKGKAKIALPTAPNVSFKKTE